MAALSNNQRRILGITVNEFYNIMFSSSSEESEEDDIEAEMLQNKNVKQHVHRLQNYVEVIIPQYTNNQFKSHFR